MTRLKYVNGVRYYECCAQRKNFDSFTTVNLFHLYAWKKPEKKSINLYSKDKLSRHVYKYISLFACVYKTISQ